MVNLPFPYIYGRSQTVIVNETPSSPCNIVSSVPQGTVLGPILFIILLIDINKDITCKLSSFADDTRVMKPIVSNSCSQTLQNDLNTIYSWQVENNMMFNEDKFEHLRYLHNKTSPNTSTYKGPNGKIILHKNDVKDLGVLMSSNLTFSAHIDKVYNKVRQMGGWILRTFNSRSKDILVPLWISLVQPHLDYCSQLWAPSKHTEISKLESLLRTYTNNIKEVRHLNFWERLKALNMYSIQRRMERYKIIYIFKILEKLVPNVGIQQYHNIRLGRFLRVPKINNSAPKTIQSSLFVW